MIVTWGPRVFCSMLWIQDNAYLALHLLGVGDNCLGLLSQTFFKRCYGPLQYDRFSVQDEPGKSISHEPEQSETTSPSVDHCDWLRWLGQAA